ncbi:hypothetical protein L21SP2_2354 [Salinispira pacifica]|uniref:Uncharacterized protein n=1 Tax=Salinispira pacifica TaxID=1307761 RepID=V5WIP5_9SPIO|nr:hypothetical protein L21SP2_2354 [Salinispira pacifica]
MCFDPSAMVDSALYQTYRFLYSIKNAPNNVEVNQNAEFSG